MSGIQHAAPSCCRKFSWRSRCLCRALATLGGSRFVLRVAHNRAIAVVRRLLLDTPLWGDYAGMWAAVAVPLLP